MDSWRESIAFWATILATLTGLLGVLQNLTWIALAGITLGIVAVAAMLSAHRQRMLLQSAAIVLRDRNLDSLGMANLRRRLNRTLAIQEVTNEAVIDGRDLKFSWHCIGYCRAAMETELEFSIDADAVIPYGMLACSAYDLRHDPRKRHPIRPILIGPEGISKKIAVPFLSPLHAQEPFNILLECRLPGCLTTDPDYYAATLSFAQDRIPRFTVRLHFLQGRPEWVRVYERKIGGQLAVLRELAPERQSGEVTEYLDTDLNVPAAYTRIYLFSRPERPSPGLPQETSAELV